MLAAKLSPDGRRTQRIRCHIRGTLEFMGQKLDIRILDISRTGMALKLEGWIEAKRGATVAVRCAELGNRVGSIKIASRGGQNHVIDRAALGLDGD